MFAIAALLLSAFEQSQADRARQTRELVEKLPSNKVEDYKDVVPGPLKCVFRHFWFLCILATTANGLVWRHRSKRFVAARPELLAGYRKLVRGWFVWANLPWVVMGVGSTVGGIASAFHFLQPLDRNPFVLAWWGSVVSVWILGTYWMFNGGAEALVEHPGLLNASSGGKYPSPRTIKLLWCVGLSGGVIGTATIILSGRV